MTGADVVLRGVTRYLRKDMVLDDVDVTMPAGKLSVLLGDAKACGRTMLKAIAGVDKIHYGAILVGGRDVTKVKAGRRDVAMVFRSDSLLPHKTVYHNIAFPLRLAEFDKRTIDERVRDVAAYFGFDDLLDKKPKRLSELQRYRISIARALVRDPAVYLFERPTPDHADAVALVTGEMRRLREEHGRTVVYATDRLDEARALGEWVVVLDGITVAQAGTLDDIHARPATVDVASMFEARLRRGVITEVDGGRASVRLKGGVTLSLPIDPQGALAGERVTLSEWPDEMGQTTRDGAPDPARCHLFDETGATLARGP